MDVQPLLEWPHGRTTERVCDWLRANGVDPNRVPASSEIEITPDYIIVDMAHLNADGTPAVDSHGHLVLVRRRFRLVVPPPDFRHPG